MRFIVRMYKQTYKTILAIFAVGLAFSSQALAGDNPDQPKITRDQCMALATKAEKIECMKKLKAQRAIEIAELAEQLAEQRSEGERLESEGERLEKEIEVLEIEILEIFRDVSRKVAEEPPSK